MNVALIEVFGVQKKLYKEPQVLRSRPEGAVHLVLVAQWQDMISETYLQFQ